MVRRRNYTNTGKGLESRLTQVATQYQTQGKALIKKCDPPSRSYIHNGQVQHQLLKNPYPDFLGVWTTQGGRGIFIEAKSTKVPRLSLGQKSGGVSRDQLGHLNAWHEAGGCVGVVWEHELQCKFVSVKAMLKILGEKRGKQVRKSIRWDEATPIPTGGMVVIDFLWNLGQEYLSQVATKQT